jgi:hypothetical protein
MDDMVLDTYIKHIYLALYESINLIKRILIWNKVSIIKRQFRRSSSSVTRKACRSILSLYQVDRYL